MESSLSSRDLFRDGFVKAGFGFGMGFHEGENRAEALEELANGALSRDHEPESKAWRPWTD
jgi:hypothetical protein